MIMALAQKRWECALATIEYKYVGDYEIEGDHEDARKVINMLAWRLRDIPPYKGHVMSVSVLDETDGEQSWVRDVSSNDDALIEEWSARARSLCDGEVSCDVSLLYGFGYSRTIESASLHLVIREGLLRGIYATTPPVPAIETERMTELISTLLPGRILPDGIRKSPSPSHSGGGFEF